MLRAVPSITGALLQGRAARSLHTGLALSVSRILTVSFVGACAVCAAACIGVQAFGNVREGRVIGGFAGFESFPEASVTMFLVTVGGPWHKLMHDCAVEPPFCTKDFDCGSLAASFGFFFPFKLAAQLLLLNMLISAALEGFLEGYALECGPLNGSAMREFRRLWREVDPDRDMTVQKKNLIPFLSNLGGSMGTEWLRALRERVEGEEPRKEVLGGARARGEDKDEKEIPPEEVSLVREDWFLAVLFAFFVLHLYLLLGFFVSLLGF